MPGFDPNGQPRIGLDNLEYHLMTRDYGMTASGAQYINTSQASNLQEIGPNVASTSTGVIIMPSNHGLTCSSLQQQQQPPPQSLQHHHHAQAVPQMGTQVIHIVGGTMGGRKLSSNDPSDEGSEDHDYYNDYQRELQPLHHRRNETTV